MLKSETHCYRIIATVSFACDDDDDDVLTLVRFLGWGAYSLLVMMMMMIIILVMMMTGMFLD